MNGSRKVISLILSFLVSTSLCYAGPLANNNVSIDLTRLSRDSDVSVDYLFDNNGTVNTAPDDTPLGATGSFDDDAETGFFVSGSLQLGGNWYINANLLQSEMEASDDFTDPAGQLEIFRLPLTNEFDAANTVAADYSSDLAGFDLNAIYRFSESVDFIIGIGSIDLEERFKIVTDDIGSAGVGTYTIRADNELQGLHVGIAMNHMFSPKLGVFFIGKLGSYDNDTRQHQRVQDSAFTRINRDSGSTTSAIMDLRLGLNYSFTERLELGVSYRLLGIEDVALAESQFDTSAAGPASIVDDDDIDWDGYSLGLRYAF